MLRQADREAFETVYARHAARLFGFLVRLCGRRDWARDLFQDTWCRLATAAQHLAADTDLLGWLLTVARNAYYDRSRRDVRLVGLSDPAALVSERAGPEPDAILHEELALLERALAQLSDLDREVLLLLGIEGLSPEQAAAVLGISGAALRKRLSRARERLDQNFSRLLETRTASNRRAR